MRITLSITRLLSHVRDWRRSRRNHRLSHEIFTKIDKLFNRSRTSWYLNWGIADSFRAYLFYEVTGDVATASLFVAIVRGALLMTLLILPFWKPIYNRPLLQYQIAIGVSILNLIQFGAMFWFGVNTEMFWAAAICMGVVIALDTTSIQQYYLQKSDHEHSAEQIGTTRTMGFMSFGFGTAIAIMVTALALMVWPSASEVRVLALLYIVAVPLSGYTWYWCARARQIKYQHADITKPGKMPITVIPNWRTALAAINGRTRLFVCSNLSIMITQGIILLVLINTAVYTAAADVDFWQIGLIMAVLHAVSGMSAPLVRLERRASPIALIVLYCIVAGGALMVLPLLPVAFAIVPAAMTYIMMLAAQSLSYGVTARLIPSKVAASVSLFQAIAYRAGGFISALAVGMLLEVISLEQVFMMSGILLIGFATILSLLMINYHEVRQYSYSAVKRIIDTAHVRQGVSTIRDQKQ